MTNLQFQHYSFEIWGQIWGYQGIWSQGRKTHLSLETNWLSN